MVLTLMIIARKVMYLQDYITVTHIERMCKLMLAMGCIVGLAYATDHVKLACIAESDPAKCVTPTSASAADKSYPIARPLFMYTNGEPQEPVKSYLDWVMSDAGQCIIAAKGYAPVRDINCE